MEDTNTVNQQNGRTSANHLDDGISRLDRTLNKIYLPEIMAARRVIHSRMRKKKERQLTGPPRSGPTLYDFIMESRRRKGGSQPVGTGEQPLDDVPEADEPRHHPAPTRQDSVFQSVDLSEIAGLREDPNRTPTPQPTFTDPPRSERQVNKAEAVAALSSDKSQVNSRSSSGHSSTRSEEVIHERYELQVKPGYADAKQLEMATAACRANEQSYTRRRNSYSNTTERMLEHRSDSTASDPGDFKEKSVRKKQQTRQSNDLDLAQKIILKRKVEEYIDRQEPGTSIDEVNTSSTEAETAWTEQSETNNVTEEVTETRKKAGSESVQTVISHTSQSPDSSRIVSQENTETSRNLVKSENSVRSESAGSDPNSRPSTAGSDFNPHPVIPAIGSRAGTTSAPVSSPPSGATPPNESPAPQATEDSDNVVPAAVTAGVVAAGTGTAAAVAIKANKSETTKNNKVADNSTEKREKKHSAKIAQPTENAEKPKVISTNADAASENTPTKPEKKDKGKTNTPAKPEKKDKGKGNTPAKPEKKDKGKGNTLAKPEKKDKDKDNKKPLSLIDMTPAEMNSTIDALERMVDANIQGVIDNTKGKKPKSNDADSDRKMVKAVMNPAFQAEINSFLAQP